MNMYATTGYVTEDPTILVFHDPPSSKNELPYRHEWRLTGVAVTPFPSNASKFYPKFYVTLSWTAVHED